jgi:hypothetical protein
VRIWGLLDDPDVLEHGSVHHRRLAFSLASEECEYRRWLSNRGIQSSLTVPRMAAADQPGDVMVACPRHAAEAIRGRSAVNHDLRSGAATALMVGEPGDTREVAH